MGFRDVDPPQPDAATAGAVPLPLVACVVRSDNYADAYDHEGPTGGEPEIGEWERTWSASDYEAAVVAVREAIARGDVYQVNLVQHLEAPFSGDAGALATRLAR